MRLHSGRSIDQATDGFNSRTLGRVRLSSSHSMTTGVLFQFTHPWEGCDLGAPTYLPIHPCFNSRTLGRVRLGRTTLLRLRNGVSIHAPWEGCDELVRDICRAIDSFNSRTLGRVRHLASDVLPYMRDVSIHAPWEGCDHSEVVLFVAFAPVSIHAPWEGCDLYLPLRSPILCRFNSRTLGRVRHDLPF